MENKNDKSVLKNPWVIGIIVLAVVGVFYIYNQSDVSLMGDNEIRDLGPGEYDEFAKYLTAQDIVMYGTEWCSHCKNNKALFGNSFQYVNFVDCDEDRSACSAAGVKGYPTWVVDGQNYPGEQSLERLAQLSGYEGEL